MDLASDGSQIVRCSSARASYLTSSLIFCGAVAIASCGGGSSVCGNGVLEPGEQCDHGAKNGASGESCNADCQSISVAIPGIRVTWDMLTTTGVPDFDGVQCGTVGAAQARVALAGPSPTSEVIDCTSAGTTFETACPADFPPTGDRATCPRITPGTYTISVTLLDKNGSPVTQPLTTMPADVQPGPIVDVSVHFGQSDFLRQDYTGTLSFHAYWGADQVGCKDAMPAVAKEEVTLIADGNTQPVSAHTLSGGTLDGKPYTCYVGDPNVTPDEEVQNLPWGKYNLTISDGAGRFKGSRLVFVQMGTLGPTFNLTVPPIGGFPDMTPAPTDGGLPHD